MRRCILLLLSALVAACSSSSTSPGDKPAPVASVALSNLSATIAAGGSVTLTVTLRDAQGNALTGRTITWTSGSPAVATVANGVVTGIAPGTTTITAASEGKSATATITVTPPPVATVSVTPPTASVQVGATTTLTAVTRDAANTELTGRTITWTSETPAVATVANGVVTGVAPGTATITAASEGTSATAQITVTPVPVATVSITPSTSDLVVGATTTLAATTKDAQGNPLTGRAITWTSGTPAVATVTDGVVTGIAPGNATITATSEGKSATAQITVTPVPVATVSITPPTASVEVGATTTLTATTKDAQGNPLTGRVITWTSGTPAIATVTDGIVTGVAPGTVAITATSEGKSATAQITVTPVPVASVTVTPPTASIEVGGTSTLIATTKDAQGNTLTGRTVTWSSGTPSIAAVANGVVTGVAPGTATITATSEGKSATSQITVTAAAAAGRATIAVAVLSACALATDGKAWCWGSGSSGTLGNGTNTSVQLTPVPVSGGRSYVDIAASSNTYCALEANGKVWCWGNGSSGQLGNGATANVNVPVQVTTAQLFTQLSGSNPALRMCALTATGEAWCWGAGDLLGNGSTGNSAVPVLVAGGAIYGQVSPGGDVSCWLGRDQTPYCASWNTQGELGLGTTGGDPVLMPTRSAGTRLFTRLFTGYRHVCGTQADGTAFCWGNNGNGRLGDNSTSTRSSPVQVTPVAGMGLLERVLPGNDHTCALTVTGTAWCWGWGNWLGSGIDLGASFSPVPLPVAGGAQYREIAVGYYSTCARLVSTGGIQCWGANTNGGLGDGTTTLRLAPVNVVGVP